MERVCHGRTLVWRSYQPMIINNNVSHIFLRQRKHPPPTPDPPPPPVSLINWHPLHEWLQSDLGWDELRVVNTFTCAVHRRVMCKCTADWWYKSIFYCLFILPLFGQRLYRSTAIDIVCVIKNNQYIQEGDSSYKLHQEKHTHFISMIYTVNPLGHVHIQ
jgi:hypothetical protein